MAFQILFKLVTNRSSPTTCSPLPLPPVSWHQPAQSSWSNPSSIDTTGYFSVIFSQMWSSCSVVIELSGLGCLDLKPRLYVWVSQLKNQEAAQSIAIDILPLYPAYFMAYWISSKAYVWLVMGGAKPPQSPTLTADIPCFLWMIFFKIWQVSVPIRIAYLKSLAPVGRIMNYCIGSSLPPCLPPFITLNAGHGRMQALSSPSPYNFRRQAQRGRDQAQAAALQMAIETAKMALAPSLALLQPYSLLDPSSPSYMSLSNSPCNRQSLPSRASLIMVLTLFTALPTLLPRLTCGSLSLNSWASYLPVEAPEGTLARNLPRLVDSSHSRVGQPRESQICLAFIYFIMYLSSISVYIGYNYPRGQYRQHIIIR